MQLSELTLKIWANEAIQSSSYPSPLFPPSAYYKFLNILNKNIKAKTAISLGVCGGGCCLYLALGNPEGKVVGVDIVEDHPQQISHIKNICPNFSFWLGDSVNDVEKIVDMFGEPQILFIDTIHTEKRTWSEFNAWLPYLSNAIVCFDDLKRVEMGNFWNDLQGNKLRLDELHATAEGGFGVWWK